MKYKILNAKEKKKIVFMLKEQYDYDQKFSYVLLQNQAGRIYIVKEEVFDLNLDNFRINSFGIYFGTEERNNIRLSIEGSQLIGKLCKRNVVEISKKQAKNWLFGSNLKVEGDFQGFVIIKSGSDFLGCGKFSNDKIHNFVPKTRRISSV